jgi:hypothetical protein
MRLREPKKISFLGPRQSRTVATANKLLLVRPATRKYDALSPPFRI